MNDQIAAILAESDFRKNAFFTDLASGEMSFDQFYETQEQFYHAVVHFTKPLSLIAAALPDYESRVKIVKNLWEEHGEGNMSATHGATFTKLLSRLSGNADVKIPAAKSAARNFNSALDRICQEEDFLRSVAVVGMVERMFADISSAIGSAIVNRGWLPMDKVVHYTLHQELDYIHAEDFFSIIRPFYAENRAVIDGSLRDGNRIFLDLYTGLRNGT